MITLNAFLGNCIAESEIHAADICAEDQELHAAVGHEDQETHAGEIHTATAIVSKQNQRAPLSLSQIVVISMAAVAVVLVLLLHYQARPNINISGVRVQTGRGGDGHNGGIAGEGGAIVSQKTGNYDYVVTLLSVVFIVSVTLKILTYFPHG
jgi:hypothetical protein